jgi:hypothetical protein
MPPKRIKRVVPDSSTFFLSDNQELILLRALAQEVDDWINDTQKVGGIWEVEKLLKQVKEHQNKAKKKLN